MNTFAGLTLLTVSLAEKITFGLKSSTVSNKSNLASYKQFYEAMKGQMEIGIQH